MILFALTVIVLFAASRTGYLNLPFYWDEAWSYATAVFTMAGDKLAILPGNADPELTRGHPLVFYFLAAAWVKVMGTKLAVVHLFPLFLSVTLLMAVFFISIKLFNRQTAMVAMVALALQAMFLAQSTQLLPEVMLALWTILTTYAYFSNRWCLFVLFSVLLVMTKETGMVLIGVLFLDKLLFERFFVHHESAKRQISLVGELAFMMIPVLAFILFMILQKIFYGWYLYPGHLNLAVTEPHEVLGRFRTFLSKLLFQHGRSLFFAMSVMAFAWLVMKKSISRPVARMMLFSVVFILLFLAFSSINFFTTRYLICILPFYLMPGSWLITTWIKNNALKGFATLALGGIFAWYSFAGYLNEQDTSLGYRKTVLLQQKAVHFAEDSQWQNKKIYVTFLMQYYLTVPYLGYLHDPSSPFSFIGNKPGAGYEVFLFCSNEPDPLYQVISNNPQYSLVKRFEDVKAWVEYYSIDRPIN